jgi:hypothetical protein
MTWIRDAFNAKPNGSIQSVIEEEQLIDLFPETSLKIKLPTLLVAVFWIGVEAEYKETSEKAVKLPITFATSCLCETGFSAIAMIKWKYQSKINVGRGIKVAV